MKALALARVLLFYALVALVVLFSPLQNTLLNYVIIIGLSLAFVAASGIKVKAGNPLPGSLVGAAAITAVFAVVLAAGGIVITGQNQGIEVILLSGAIVQLAVATGEELAFRQYVFADLDRTAGRTAAMAASAAAFALLHLPAMLRLGTAPASMALALAGIFVAGLLLAVLYAYGGILSAIGLHFCWNYLQYSVYGLSYVDAVLAVEKTGSPLLNGGSFGPEASIPGLIVLILALIAVTWYYRYKADKPLSSEAKNSDCIFPKG